MKIVIFKLLILITCLLSSVSTYAQAKHSFICGQHGCRSTASVPYSTSIHSVLRSLDNPSISEPWEPYKGHQHVWIVKYTIPASSSGGSSSGGSSSGGSSSGGSSSGETVKWTPPAPDWRFVQYDNTTSEISDPRLVSYIGGSGLVVQSGYRPHITRISIHDNVTSIDDGAFSNCTLLENVEIPSNVNKIGANAFSGCTSLKSVSFSSGKISEIGIAAFKNCNLLENFVLPDKSINEIKSYTFYGSGLKTFTIPHGTEKIGGFAFASSKLKSIQLPDTLNYIDNYAFSDTKQTRINIPSSVTYIAPYAFDNSKHLIEINVSKENLNYTSYNGVLFDKNMTTLKTFPEGITGDYIIPDGVKAIDEGAFSNCLNLISITIPDSIDTIAPSAFEHCKNLKKIIFNGNAPTISGVKGIINGITVREFDNIAGVSIDDLLKDNQFPNSPTLEKNIDYFEWPQSGNIAIHPPTDVKDKYAVQIIGFLHPPQTGKYKFGIAADDNAQLMLSTDKNPNNKRLIANETRWNRIRSFVERGNPFTHSNTISDPIYLEKGKLTTLKHL